MGCLGAGEGLAKTAPPPPTTLPCTSAPQLVLFYGHTRPLRLTNSPDLQVPPPSPPDLENGMRLRGSSQVPALLSCLPASRHPPSQGSQGAGHPTFPGTGWYLLALSPALSVIRLLTDRPKGQPLGPQPGLPLPASGLLPRR